MLQEPILPGCFLRAKAIGLMPMIDQVNIFSVVHEEVIILLYFVLLTQLFFIVVRFLALMSVIDVLL